MHESRCDDYDCCMQVAGLTRFCLETRSAQTKISRCCIPMLHCSMLKCTLIVSYSPQARGGRQRPRLLHQGPPCATQGGQRRPRPRRLPQPDTGYGRTIVHHPRPAGREAARRRPTRPRRLRRRGSAHRPCLQPAGRANLTLPVHSTTSSITFETFEYPFPCFVSFHVVLF